MYRQEQEDWGGSRCQHLISKNTHSASDTRILLPCEENYPLECHLWFSRKCLLFYVPATWFSTNMAMSINMSWSSLMLLSSLTMSLCRPSISLRACLEIWESMIYNRSHTDRLSTTLVTDWPLHSPQSPHTFPPLQSCKCSPHGLIPVHWSECFGHSPRKWRWLGYHSLTSLPAPHLSSSCQLYNKRNTWNISSKYNSTYNFLLNTAPSNLPTLLTSHPVQSIFNIISNNLHPKHILQLRLLIIPTTIPQSPRASWQCTICGQPSFNLTLQLQTHPPSDSGQLATSKQTQLCSLDSIFVHTVSRTWSHLPCRVYSSISLNS